MPTLVLAWVLLLLLNQDAEVVAVATALGADVEPDPQCDTRRLIVVGSGRCGTKAFSDLVNRQPGAFVFHEGNFEVVESSTIMASGERGGRSGARSTLSVEQIKLCNGIPWDSVADDAMSCLSKRAIRGAIFKTHGYLSARSDCSNNTMHVMDQRAAARFRNVMKASEFLLQGNWTGRFTLANDRSNASTGANKSINGQLYVLGDIGFHYLPYVDSLLRLDPCLQVVVLRRDRQDTLSSFEAWFGDPSFRHFPWASQQTREAWRQALDESQLDTAMVRQIHKHSVGEYLDHPQYDSCYPSFNWRHNPTRPPTIREGADRWYNFVYNFTQKLAVFWPTRVLEVDTYRALNRVVDSRDVLHFVFGSQAGVQQPRTVGPSQHKDIIFNLNRGANGTPLFHPTNATRALEIAAQMHESPASRLDSIDASGEAASQRRTAVATFTPVAGFAVQIFQQCEQSPQPLLCCTPFDFYMRHIVPSKGEEHAHCKYVSLGELDQLCTLPRANDRKQPRRRGLEWVASWKTGCGAHPSFFEFVSCLVEDVVSSQFTVT